jgi:hypothetical protein
MAVTTSLLTFEQTSPWIADLLDRARERRIRVIAFTDEELLALDGLDAEQVAPNLWLSTQPEQRHEFAAAVAMRGLVARGTAKLGTPTEDGRVVLALPQDASAALAMRRAASAVYICEQRTHDSTRARVLYLQGEHGVLEEDVNSGGLHTFSVSTAAEAFSALTAWCNPFGSPLTTNGAQRRAGLTELATGDEVARELGKATVVSVLAAVSPAPSGTEATTQEHRLSVYAFDDHLEVGMPDADDPTEMVYRWVDEPALAAALAELAGERP